MTIGPMGLGSGDPPSTVEIAKADFRTAGAAARRAGQAREACPYLPETLARKFWLEGWDHG